MKTNELLVCGLIIVVACAIVAWSIFEPKIPENTTQTYSMRMPCNNCSVEQDRRVEIVIPKGVHVNTYQTVCPNCNLTGMCILDTKHVETVSFKTFMISSKN